MADRPVSTDQVDLLNWDGAQHVIGVQLHRCTPKWSLEDVVVALANTFVSGLNKQPRPFQRL